MSDKTVRVIIARYKEKVVDWLSLLPPDYEVVVSNSGMDDIESSPRIADVVKVPNRGRDLGHWIKYIADHYDSLADINVFLQGNPHVGHTYDILFNLERNVLEAREFNYLCNTDFSRRRLGGGSFNPRFVVALAAGRGVEVPDMMSGGVWGAQHFASRDVIHQRPQEFYAKLYALADMDMFAHHLEHGWNVIYGIPPSHD